MPARYAEIIARQLTVVGGGRDLLEVDGPLSPIMVGIVIGIEVPWLAIGQTFILQVRIEDEDGRELPLITGDLTIDTGQRDDTLPDGMPARAYYGTTVPLAFARPGTYRLVASIIGGGSGRALVHVRFRPG